MKRAIAIVSGKGGAGKTTLAANLGVALRERGKDVVLVDADLMTSNLSIQLGHFQLPVTIQNVLEGKAKFSEALYTHPSGVRFIPSSISLKCLYSPTPYRLKNILRRAEGIVLIDSPPGLGREVALVLKACSEVIVVTNPDFSAVADAMKTVSLAREMKKEVLGIVVNRSTGSFEVKNRDIEEMCGARVIRNIPEDGNIRKSHFMRMPVLLYSPRSKASREFRGLAAYLTGEPAERPSLWRRLLGW
jgi:septum site-determining protein MinD